MPKILFSDVGLRSLPSPESGTADYWDRSLPSFGCRVSQGGTKTFVLKLHNSRRAIGRYPIITLAEARNEARRMLAEKTLGKVRPQSTTVKAAIKIFIEEKKQRRRARTVHDYEYRLNKHYSLPGQLEDVAFAELSRRLERIKSASSYNSALANGRAFFNWCVKRRYISNSPLTGLSPRKLTSRSRILTDDELKAVWIASDQCGTFGVIVKLLILTGQQRSGWRRFRFCIRSINYTTEKGHYRPQLSKRTAGGRTIRKRPALFGAGLCFILLPLAAPE